jgi:hypothetical protein
MTDLLDRDNKHLLLEKMNNSNNSFIANVNNLAKNLEYIIQSNNLFSPEVIPVLQEIAGLNLHSLVEDLTKGTYLGNRKIDINLLYNLSSYDPSLTQGELEALWLDVVSLPKYDSATIIFKEGTSHTTTFTFDGNPITIATHADLLLQLNNDTVLLGKLNNTLISTFPTTITGEFIRFYDTTGASSNIERIVLHVASGYAKDIAPAYFWGDTTSALGVMATRSTDFIRIGNEIDNIIQLANNINQLMELQARIPELIDTYTEDEPNGDVTVYNELEKLLEIYDNLTAIVSVFNSIEGVTAISENLPLVEEVSENIIPNLSTILQTPSLASAAQTYANNAASSMNAAATSAGVATSKANEIKSVSVERVITGVAGTPAQVIYSGVTGKFTFVIPQGARGEQGRNFNPDARGTFAQRTTYDAMAEGFSFLAIDLGEIYFREGAAGNWSTGAPFAKGDKGDTGDDGRGIVSVTFSSTTSPSGNPAQSGATDTYEVTYIEGASSFFDVYNGLDYTLPASTNKVYVSKQGSNFNDGLTLDKPKLTLTAAITVASTLLSAGATRVTIEIMDTGTYTENIEVPQNVMLYGINATLEGTLIVNNNTYVWLYGHYAAASSTTMVTKKGNAHAYYRCVIQDASGIVGSLTGCTNIATNVTGSIFFVEIELQRINFKGILETTASGNGHIHIRIKAMHLVANDAIAISATGTESDVIGQVDHILPLGSLTGTVGVYCNTLSGNVDLRANEIIANTAYAIVKGDVRLNCAKVVGAKVGTPVLDLSRASHILGVASSQTRTISNGAISPTAADVVVDTEGASAADDLTDINVTEAHNGMILRLWAANKARVITVKHSSTLQLAGKVDRVLTQHGYLELKRNGTYWQETPRKDVLDLQATITANNTYSWAEIDTGRKWIDGRTIYAITQSLGTLPNNTDKDVVLSISNYDQIVSPGIVGFALSNGSTPKRHIPLPFGDYVTVHYLPETATIRTVTNGNYTSYTISRVTMYYVKTA